MCPARIMVRFIACSLLALCMMQVPVNADAPVVLPEETKAGSADLYELRLAENSREAIVIAMADSGKVVYCRNETQLFNPASNTKMATALVVMRKFGAHHRFQTQIRSNGKLNAEGELEGDLFVSGQDPLFSNLQGLQLASILKQKKIKSIKGDFCISKDFSMLNYRSHLPSHGMEDGKLLLANLDPGHISLKSLNLNYGTPTLKLHGQVRVADPPANSKIIACHQSAKLQTMLKTMLCLSDNEMAERLGELIGGPKGLTNYLIENLGINKDELSFSTTSGVSVNRMSARAMMKVLLALRSDLSRSKMSLSDLLPVAGVDDGTMKNRLCTAAELGSVIAKTGSLWDVDNGASALSGEMNTCSQGRFLFVIFNMNGLMDLFRKRQDFIVSQFQMDHSGPRAYKYTPLSLDASDDYWSK